MGKFLYLDAGEVDSLMQSTANISALQKELADAEHNYNTMIADYRKMTAQLTKDKEFLGAVREKAVGRDVIVALITTFTRCDEIRYRSAEYIKRIFDGWTLEQIGEEYGLSPNRVRTIIYKSLRRLEESMFVDNIFEENKQLRKELTAARDDEDRLIKECQRMDTALKAANDYIESLDYYASHVPEKEVMDTLPDNDETRLYKLLMTPYWETELRESKGTYLNNVMRRADIQTVGDLCRLNRADFKRIRMCGEKVLAVVEAFLEKHNLTWGMDVDAILRSYTIHNILKREF